MQKKYKLLIKRQLLKLKMKENPFMQDRLHKIYKSEMIRCNIFQPLGSTFLIFDVVLKKQSSFIFYENRNCLLSHVWR